MFDKVETLGQSLIQHGNQNNRIYLMKLAESDFPQILNKLDDIAREKKYTKIFAKIPEWARKTFIRQGYQERASIPKFYGDEADVYFVSKFLDSDRANIEQNEKNQIKNIIHLAISKQNQPVTIAHDHGYKLRILDKNDAGHLINLYDIVFESYPFPIHNSEYIIKTMDESIVYFGAFDGEKLVAASSAEMDLISGNVEMTDFATLPEYRGKSLSLLLLREMEAEMVKRKIRTFYTIARAVSPGMNITFSRMGYQFAGTLINNTDISGSIESMNVWYKIF
ncbi:MAG: putative beta-lysine N-acetyltransferase [Calditrichaceae bacterium]